MPRWMRSVWGSKSAYIARANPYKHNKTDPEPKDRKLMLDKVEKELYQGEWTFRGQPRRVAAALRIPYCFTDQFGQQVMDYIFWVSRGWAPASRATSQASSREDRTARLGLGASSPAPDRPRYDSGFSARRASRNSRAWGLSHGRAPTARPTSRPARSIT